MKHVIIGAGAAGITAAKTIRKLCPQDEIIMISVDEQVHSRCMLHKYLSHERDAKGISFIPDDFFEKYQIQWSCGKRIDRLVPVEKKVLLQDQSEISYDKLLVATGAESFIPPVGALRTASNVFGLRHLSDATAIDKRAKAATNIVIIGSGLVGLDAAFGLMEQGKKVTVVEMAEQILPIQLDRNAAGEYQKRFEEAGCQFYLGRKGTDTITDEQGLITKLVLDNKEALDCDLIIVAAGVRPAIDLFEDSGLKVERSIVVNGTLQTSNPDIYAAGDVTGLSGIWPNAMKQGKIAAMNMCGGNYQYIDRYALKNTINFFGLVSLGVGELTPKEGDVIQIEECSKGYKRAILRNHVLVGILLQGDISNAGIYQYLIKHQIDLSSIERNVFYLNFGDFYGVKSNGEFDYA